MTGNEQGEGLGFNALVERCAGSDSKAQEGYLVGVVEDLMKKHFGRDVQPLDADIIKVIVDSFAENAYAVVKLSKGVVSYVANKLLDDPSFDVLKMRSKAMDVMRAHITPVLEEGKEGRLVVQRSCFFGYLDILGFKDVVKNNTFDQLKDIVERFTVKCAETMDRSRSILSNTRISIDSGVHARIVSDSILVWTEKDDQLKQFEDLLHIVNAMLASGFQQGLPLRGAVTFGELFLGNVKIPESIPLDFSFDTGSVYGKALVEAYELESKMDWSGAILTPRAWAKVEGEFERWGEGSVIMRSGSIKSSIDLFNHYPYLLWYDVPFKNGTRKRAIAFNWNYKPGFELSAEMIRKAFTQRCGTDDTAVKLKLKETIRFYEYSQRVDQLCGVGLKKALPVPDSDYVLSELVNA